MSLRIRRIPHQRLQLLSLVALALIPLMLFGLIAWGHLGGLVSSDAERETNKTLDAADAVLRQREQNLSAAIQSYATWEELSNRIEAGDEAWIKSVVLDFSVDHDVADAALLIRPGTPVLSGSEPLTAAILAELERHPSAEPSTTLVALPDGIYELAVWPLAAPASAAPPSGASATAAPSGAPVLAFAQRLGEGFVADARAMTGWDVAIAGANGEVRVATNLQRFVDLTADRQGDPPGSRQTPTVAGGSRALLDAAGNRIGWLLVATDLGAVGSISQQVLVLLAITLAPAVAAALLLSLGLSFQIRRRVRVIERGIGAVAAGDLSVRLPEGDRDEFERLASSHNRLATALEHQQMTLSLLLEATVALSPDAGVAAIARQGVASAAEIFDLQTCELLSADGTVVASARPPGHGADAEAGEPGSGSAVVSHGDRVWELRWAGLRARWVRADEDLLRVYAAQLGAALADAELYERAEERAKALDRVNRLQANFLRGVSHNLQSPLTSIVGLSDELRLRTELPAEARDRAEVIHSDAQRLRMLVRQLLTMSRLEAGTLHVETEPFAAGPVVRRAWRAQRSERTLLFRDRAEHALVVGDADALEQVLWILFDNALRYAPAGPIEALIEVAATDRVRITVEDEGPGVPVEERDHIFRRFARGSSSAGHEGTGLGLDVARGLLGAMGGSIRYEPGRVGAAFVVELPAELASSAV